MKLENDTEFAAQRDLVSPDGWGIGSKYINWSTAPNYYHNGRMIVINDGDKRLVWKSLLLRWASDLRARTRFRPAALSIGYSCLF
jgi:hypothetical protein